MALVYIDHDFTTKKRSVAVEVAASLNSGGGMDVETYYSVFYSERLKSVILLDNKL